MGEPAAGRGVQGGSRVPLTTPRLVLRRYEPTDLASLEDLVASSLDNIRPWMPNAARELSGDLGEWLGMARDLFDRGERYPYAIALTDGTFVGHITATPDEDSTVEFGYWIHTGYLRKGYMSEAVAALIAQFAPATFVIHCALENAASAGVARKAGFAHVGYDLRDGHREMRWELVVPPRYN